MAHNLIHAKSLDVANVSFDEVKKTQLGQNMVYLKYNGHQKIMMQTPIVSAPFGLSTYTDEKSGITKYSLDISFRGMEEDSKIKEFFDKMSSLDDLLVSEGVKNAKEWFGKKVSKEVVENFYRPIIKPSKDPSKYAPTMKFKIQTARDGNIQLDAYDHNRNKVDISEALLPGSKVRLICECKSIWFINKSMFGVSFQAIQVVIQKSDRNSQNLQGGCLYRDFLFLTARAMILIFWGNLGGF